MTLENESRPAHPARPLRRWFVLSSVLIFAAGVLAAVVWLLLPNRATATALFQIMRATPTILSNESILAPENYELLKKTQRALLRSEFVLTAALRDPGVASLPTLAGVDDPVEWLAEHLHVEYPEEGEILSISLAGPTSQSTDLVRIVDAVAKAYRDEVIYENKQLRLATRDLLARSLENLNKEIERKYQVYLDIARESGRADRGSAPVLQQLDLRRLDRIENELMRLENTQNELQDGGDSASLDVVVRRIEQLRARQEQLQSQIVSRVEVSVALESQQRDLGRLQRIADEMATTLEKLDIEANAPERIRQIQQATPGVE
jgi:hypothetical protein